jgi:hypothetical protein
VNLKKDINDTHVVLTREWGGIGVHIANIALLKLVFDDFEATCRTLSFDPPASLTVTCLG